MFEVIVQTSCWQCCYQYWCWFRHAVVYVHMKLVRYSDPLEQLINLYKKRRYVKLLCEHLHSFVDSILPATMNNAQWWHRIDFRSIHEHSEERCGQTRTLDKKLIEHLFERVMRKIIQDYAQKNIKELWTEVLVQNVSKLCFWGE